MKSCLMILNYNGQAHLKECLDSALAATQVYGADCPVVVVDNCSSDNDVEVIQKNYPTVEVLKMPKNDYLFSYNQALASRTEDVVFLLNNDMRYDAGFIAFMIRHFKDERVFAVSAKTMDWHGEMVLTARRTASIKNFWLVKKWEEADAAIETFEFCGGACAVRRAVFLQLGGFDRLYYPGYCEDTDLSARAHKAGWKILYEPQAIIYHKANASFQKNFAERELECLIRRNEVLFAVKNVGSALFAAAYLFLLPIRALRSYWNKNLPLAIGILRAAPFLLTAWCKRFECKYEK